jgi:hypothetical protein
MMDSFQTLLSIFNLRRHKEGESFVVEFPTFQNPDHYSITMQQGGAVHPRWIPG